MVPLIYIILFSILGKVFSLQFCSSLTQNGWFSVDPANLVCFKYNNKTSTWWDAKRACEEEGLFLARPDRESIEEFIEDKRSEYSIKPNFWIDGINQKDSGWKWANGDIMEFSDFDLVTGTINRIVSFFKKSTSCAMYGVSNWFKKSCDELAPYLCQSERNTTLTVAEADNRYPRTRFSDISTKFCRHASGVGCLGWNLTGTHCFVYFEERSTWWDANKTCHEQNMTLVIISGSDINFTLSPILIYTISDFWIGAINQDDTGWKWGNGQEMLYENFNSLTVTWDRISKKTLCGVYQSYGWHKNGCDRLYPFVCQFSQMSTTTPPEKTETRGKPTSPGTINPVPIAVQQHRQKLYKAKKVVGGLLNPKLTDSGMRSVIASNVIHCCRLCSRENGCELVNYCETTASCVLFGSIDSAMNGEVTSQLGCSVYVNVERVD